MGLGMSVGGGDLAPSVGAGGLALMLDAPSSPE